ncbi:cell division protein FtsQ/DivIB [Candidatus Pelagibacter communis]|uniref:cell division protein FtsQ/DivIB n=1 Tax=Pelagibacter ubique TaxID=198252 RepID=UPI00094D41BE|nr:hypothetical protein [Candidatus Pelagibacter ubique]
MLQKIDKKNYILFYFIIFLILSSIHNSNLKLNNFFNVKKIEVLGLDKKNSIILEKKLVSLIGYNIFTLKKESFNFMNSLNFIKDYSVKKIYPNHVKVFFESAEAISTIKYLNELVVLGNNGKIIKLENLPTNVPKIIGTKNIKKAFRTLKMIDKSDLEIEKIMIIEFFPSERIDVELRNKKKIKFSTNLSVDNFNFGSKLLNDDEFNKSRIIDLRIPNKIITYD